MKPLGRRPYNYANNTRTKTNTSLRDPCEDTHARYAPPNKRYDIALNGIRIKKYI